MYLISQLDAVVRLVPIYLLTYRRMLTSYLFIADGMKESISKSLGLSYPDGTVECFENW